MELGFRNAEFGRGERKGIEDERLGRCEGRKDEG